MGSEIAVLNPLAVNLIAKINNPMLSKKDIEEIDWYESPAYKSQKKEEEKMRQQKEQDAYFIPENLKVVKRNIIKPIKIAQLKRNFDYGEGYIFNKKASTEYDEFVKQSLSLINSSFPNVKLHSFNSFKLFLDNLVPKLVHKYLILSGSMKNCSGISPDFSEIAVQSGFPVLTMIEPGHQLNLVLTTDGPYSVDLSHIQFLCKHEANNKEERQEVLKNYKKLYDNPFLALKIEKLPKQYYTNVRLPHGVYDNLRPNPASQIEKYDIKETEEFFPKIFKNIKEAQIRRNFDYGEGLYSQLDKYKSVSDFRKKRRGKRKKILQKIRGMKLK
jgi:hypothetical protein